MSDNLHGEFKITVGNHVLGLVPSGLPSLYGEYRAHAIVADEFALDGPGLCCITVARGGDWPFLIVAQSTGRPAGQTPGALLAADQDKLFVGAGERLLAYDLREPRRLWADSAEAGFWGWSRHGDVVLMAAELEFAAWTAAGEKLWTTFVEPPWTFQVEGETVRLDVMGAVEQFPLRAGRRSSRET